MRKMSETATQFKFVCLRIQTKSGVESLLNSQKRADADRMIIAGLTGFRNKYY